MKRIFPRRAAISHKFPRPTVDYQNKMTALQSAALGCILLLAVVAGVLGVGATPAGEFPWKALTPCAVVLAALIVLAVKRRLRARFARAALEELLVEAGDFAAQAFLVKPCTRCQQSAFKLLRCTPEGRSLEYECLTCAKKYWAAACAKESPRMEELLAEIDELAAECGAGEESPPAKVLFQTEDAPLPYEVTTREPIPEALRAEVWRRDLGRCVRCGSNKNLQFDHIIPVSKGGATTAQNLQLLCQACNRQKGSKI